MLSLPSRVRTVEFDDIGVSVHDGVDCHLMSLESCEGEARTVSSFFLSSTKLAKFYVTTLEPAIAFLLSVGPSKFCPTTFLAHTPRPFCPCRK